MTALRIPFGELSLSADLLEPPSGAAPVTVVLAHGAGNDMSNPLLVAVQAGLAKRGFAVLRFNFPYKERGRKLPDAAKVLEGSYRAVLAHGRDTGWVQGKLVIGGKSMGGRMASHLAGAGEAIDGLVFLGYPLHPAGKPERIRDAHLPA
ncbi:MAG TPA: alpha/beta family hydrolase, partial [Terriglobales bacterium]|nr:alpha/beta family hydrolase [Terriglobales bacterium]